MAFVMRDIFLKAVDRPIDGVIKADDAASLRTELEEYVITQEIAQRLEQFLEAYNNYSTANGVWISGFFGSGKSHLLKMLAYVLENHDINGVPAYELFKDKKELDENPMLAGALRKAISIPSKSILFNIDQKADVISKTEVDALLSVFQKVFDEMCGYYGKQPHIAQFERDLDERGVLEAFRTAYASVAGKPWERGREQALLERGNIAKAYAQASGTAEADASDILGHYRKDHRVSIEDFATTVKRWIDRQGPKFRLNFFVDEVGQYIADNTKLMTNLQTIAESLNTRCKGQAWVLVTAQQDMSKIIGDTTGQQQNDFSKIQARFATRMPLNSADVAEVIQRRLLAKTEEGSAVLSNLHSREEHNLKTLFSFADGSIRLKNFEGQDHFVRSYPFPPYQYTLFQMAIRSLSEHNAFEGKHSSVGERSMLGVFQEVAKRLADIPVGDIATFDLMFEGIRSALKSSVQQSIHIAERNLGDPFAVRVLKALFLVKYVKEFKPTVRNIGILLLSEFNADQIAQRRKIEEALGLLERSSLIQRNGEVYEFLTNEEVDVQNEIKALDVDPSEITKELETLVFEETIRHKRIRYTATGNDYPFSRKLDDRLLGREWELAVNVISPFDEAAAAPEGVRMQTMSRDELAVVLPQDALFTKDLILYKQTDKFVRQARAGSPQPGRDRIVAEKGEQNARRRADLKARLHKLMAEARLFVRGEDVELAGEDPQERVVRAFQTLVDKVYVNLPMLRGIGYSEADISRALSPSAGLFGPEGSGVTEAEQEVLNHAQAQARIGVRVTAKALLERFEAKPYGWPPVAVLCVTAGLLGRGKLKARSDSTVMEGEALARALKNSNMLGNILLAPQVEFTASQIRKAKDLFREVFDGPPEGGDARAIGAEFAAAFEKLRQEINALRAQRATFPFLAALDPVAETVEAVAGKPAAWYLTDLPQHEDRLLDAKEQVLDPVRSFMAGSQRGIYEEVSRFLRDQASNFAYVGTTEAEAMRRVVEDLASFRGNAIQGLKAKHFDLKSSIDLKLIEERKVVEAALADSRAKLEALPEFERLSEAQRANLIARIDTAGADLGRVSLIAELRERASSVRQRLFPELLAEVERLSRPVEPPRPPSGPGEPPAPPPPPPPTFVHWNTIQVASPKAYLAEEADLEVWLDALRRTLLAEIQQGKRIIV
ncbi:BREX system P-loop protein BrxC [Rubellimicrobium rubrum]|uniref:BREX system P-loop protein BrxC n=1 Tax=Rubellimicrobium rubrum TaxID=2585369 RepID=A0A5C4MTV1_9RHOB|nr:BREX system P-loop protein BrxC [Rubellimicrobium rubrum]TNC49324.1 BREX system P-loop protein BrxC [Rubellimicrobium rubrum]